MTSQLSFKECKCELYVLTKIHGIFSVNEVTNIVHKENWKL